MIERFQMYGGEIELLAIFNNDKHEYRVKLASEPDEAASLVPGPTTPLGVLDKPLLVPWAAKMAVKDAGYYEKQVWTPNGYIPVSEEDQAKGFERMVSIHNRLKTMDPKEYWEFLHQSKSAHRRSKNAAADSGTLAHAWVEAFIAWKMGRADEPALPSLPEVRPAVDAWLKWYASAGEVVFTLSEQKVYSRKHVYAGTLDFACTINGVPTMGDLKTSNFFNPEMFWQVSAYQYARLEEFPDERYEKQIIVRCGKDGELEVKESDRYEHSIRAFLATWIIWKEKQIIKKIYKESQTNA